MGAILSKFWPNRSNNNTNNEPQLAITAPPVRLPLLPPPPPPSSSTTLQISDKNSASNGKDSSPTHIQAKKTSKKQQQQQLIQQSRKSPVKTDLPPSKQSFIYKTVLEATVSDAIENEAEARKRAEEAPGPFEIETDLLSPEIEEAVIKIQANVRGYLTRKQYRATPERSIEKPSGQVNNERGQTSNERSGIFAPPPSFSDTPKEPPLDDYYETANQGKKIAEKLIELEKQVSQANIKSLDVSLERRSESYTQSTYDRDVIADRIKLEDQKNCTKGEEKSSQSLEIPTIETDDSSVPEEAAIKIQAAFRGYQVRKTISREPSPCKSREETNDSSFDGSEVVHLREKDGNTTQDPERESILVLNQLEECLSQELMRTSTQLGDEVSLSSYSTDTDLNASFRSNTSGMVTTESDEVDTCDVKTIPSDVLESSPKSTSSDVEITQNDMVPTEDKPLVMIARVPSDSDDNIEFMNNEKIVQPSQEISSIDQVPNNFQSDLSNDSTVEAQNNQKIGTESVVFVCKEEKVNANDEPLEVNIKNEKQSGPDPVVLIELGHKLDASNIPKVSEESAIKSNGQSAKVVPMVESKRNDEMESLTEQEMDSKQKESFDLGEKKTDAEREILTDLPSSSVLNQVPDHKEEVKPLLSKSLISEPQIVTKSTPFKLFQESGSLTNIRSPILSELSSCEMLSSDVSFQELKNDSTSQINTNNESDSSAFNVTVQDLKPKANKLFKEDSFGSDILILDEETIDKSDTLYDIIADQGLTVNEPVGDLFGSSFADDNLVKSIVENVKSDEDDLMLLMSTSEPPSNITNEKLPESVDNENIIEIKGHFLVDLDESDSEEDSQKGQINQPSNSRLTQNDSQISESITAVINLEDEVNDQLTQERLSHSILGAGGSDSQPVKLSSSIDLGNEEVTSTVQLVDRLVKDHSEKSPDNQRLMILEDFHNKNLPLTHNEEPDERKPADDSLTTKSNDNINQGSETYTEMQKQSSEDEVVAKSSEKSLAQMDIEYRKISTNPFLNEDYLGSDEYPQSLKDISENKSSTDLSTIQAEQPIQTVTKTTSQPSKLDANNSTILEPKPKINLQKEIELIQDTFSNISDDPIGEPIEEKEKPVYKGDAELQQSIDDSSSLKPTDINYEPSITKESTSSDLSCSQSEILQSRSIQDNLPKEEASSKSDASGTSESLAPIESTSSPQLTLTFESTVEQASEMTATNQPTTIILESNDESEDRSGTDLCNPDGEATLLRVHDREARSKSPNPFGRKKRKPRKGRGGQQ